VLKPLAALIATLVRDEATRGDGLGRAKPARLLFASVAQLAACLGLHPTNVRPKLHALVKVGVLEEIAPGGGRRRFGKRVAGVRTTYLFRPENLPPREVHTLATALPFASVNTSDVASVTPPNPSAPARAIARVEELAREKKELTTSERRRTRRSAGDGPLVPLVAERED
jgi:hypothetical protein